MEIVVKQMKIAQIVALLNTVTWFPFETHMSHSDMREIVEMAHSIDDENIMDMFVFQVARTVDSITKKAEETEKEMGSLERRFSEDVETHDERKNAEEAGLMISAI